MILIFLFDSLEKEHDSEEHDPEKLQEDAAAERQEDPAEVLWEGPEREQIEVNPEHGPEQGRNEPATGGRRHPVPWNVKTLGRYTK